MLRVEAAELDRMVRSPHGVDELGDAVLVEVTGTPTVGLAGVPAVLVGVDVEPDERLEPAVRANPMASVALAVLLRGERSFASESATYALLQGGPEHRAWLAANRRPPRPPDGRAPVRTDRVGDELRVTLDRPHVRNAFDAAMRDGLREAFAVAALDPDLRVVVRGEGPSFCSGGDLDEFGTTPDPATAHLVRLRRSAGRALATIAGRTTVHVHGACVGAGVELPAFAARVVAHPDATFRLPEVAMGLVPGAGGTVSIPARIGTRAFARLVLVGDTLTASAALALGLVDGIST